MAMIIAGLGRKPGTQAPTTRSRGTGTAPVYVSWRTVTAMVQPKTRTSMVASEAKAATVSSAPADVALQTPATPRAKSPTTAASGRAVAHHRGRTVSRLERSAARAEVPSTTTNGSQSAQRTAARPRRPNGVATATGHRIHRDRHAGRTRQTTPVSTASGMVTIDRTSSTTVATPSSTATGTRRTMARLTAGTRRRPRRNGVHGRTSSPLRVLRVVSTTPARSALTDRSTTNPSRTTPWTYPAMPIHRGTESGSAKSVELEGDEALGQVGRHHHPDAQGQVRQHGVGRQ